METVMFSFEQDQVQTRCCIFKKVEYFENWPNGDFVFTFIKHMIIIMQMNFMFIIILTGNIIFFENKYLNDLRMSIKNTHILEEGQTGYKYSYKMQFLKMSISIPFPCEVKFVWKRATGDSIESQKLISITPN